MSGECEGQLMLQREEIKQLAGKNADLNVKVLALIAERKALTNRLSDVMQELEDANEVIRDYVKQVNEMAWSLEEARQEIIREIER